MPAKSPIRSEQRPTEETGRVLPFDPRRRAFRMGIPRPPSSVEDVGKYAGGADERDDWHHRMKMNAVAAVVLGLLIWSGYWLFDTIAEMRKNQDCALIGRSNCTRLNLPVSDR
jgi:hypothetical protein